MTAPKALTVQKPPLVDDSLLDENTDKLNALLLKVEKCFTEKKLFAMAFTPIHEPHHEPLLLGFTKRDGAWKLVVSDKDGSTPLLSTRRETRVAAASHLSTLLEALLVAKAELNQRVIVAVKQAEAFVSSLTENKELSEAEWLNRTVHWRDCNNCKVIAVDRTLTGRPTLTLADEHGEVIASDVHEHEVDLAEC